MKSGELGGCPHVKSGGLGCVSSCEALLTIPQSTPFTITL